MVTIEGNVISLNGESMGCRIKFVGVSYEVKLLIQVWPGP
jgi:hypothetical protein